MNISIQTEGRRHYITGDTYPIKDAIRAAGCKWDRDRGAWWTGKRDTAEGLVSRVQSGAVEAKASFAKLANGEWGVRVPGAVEAGTKVTVAGKYGEKTVTIAAIVETTDRGTVCSIAKEARKPRSSGRTFTRRSGGRCKSPGCCNPADQHAPHHRAMDGYCGSCAFDEFDM